MDAPKYKASLLSDVHVPIQPRVVAARLAAVTNKRLQDSLLQPPAQPFSRLSSERPKKYVSDVIMARPAQPQAYARFYRLPSDVITKKSEPTPRDIAEDLQASLAMQAVTHAKALIGPATVPGGTLVKPKVVKHKSKQQRRTKLVANLTIAVAITMSGVLGFLAYKYHIALQKVEAHPLQQDVTESPAETAVSASAAKLDETAVAPAAQSASRLATDTPYKLSIPKLKVLGGIIGVGVSKTGAMAVPGNIWQVGWAKTSSKPRDNSGVIVLNGHVHGPTQPGIFANLKNLKPGDAITLSEVSGATFNYKVVSSQTFKAGEVADNLYQSVSPTKQGLNLITCTGAIKDSEYQNRLVVYAERT